MRNDDFRVRDLINFLNTCDGNLPVILNGTGLSFLFLYKCAKEKVNIGESKVKIRNVVCLYGR